MMLSTQPSGEGAATAPGVDTLLVRIANELYGLLSASVREVVRYRPWTPVPGAPESLPGIISQRGMILPVVDLRPLLGLEHAELTRSARLVVAIHDEIGMAILVEEVLDLIGIASEAIEPAPAALEVARARFLRGIARYDGRPVSLLDLDALIAALREAS